MLRARDIMTPEVKTVEPGMPVGELEQAFLEHGVSGFPVVDGERLVGVISRSDIVRRLTVEASLSGQLSDYYRETGAGDVSSRAEAAEAGIRMAGATVADAMCPSVVSVQADDPVPQVARLMATRGFHRLPVLDGERLEGIITSLDLVKLLAELPAPPAETRSI